MRNLLAMAMLVLLVPFRGAAQDPFYLLFNSQCMDVVEYRYVYTQQSVFAFSAKPNATEQFLFMAGEGALQVPTLPPSTIDCRNLYLDDSFVDAINAEPQGRPMYIIQQTQGGYLMTPIVRATRFVQTGRGFTARSADYYFAFDPQVHNGSTNLWIAGSKAAVYYRGQELRRCRYVYTFSREAVAGNAAGVLEYAPGVGLISERVGRTAQEAQQNQMVLHKVNDQLLSDYLIAGCEGVTVPLSEVKPVFTQPPVVENREAASIGILESGGYLNSTPTNPSNATAYPSAPSTPVDCNLRSGRGYHVVQRGESLLAISRRYKVALNTLVKLNNLPSPDRLEVCQVIMVANTKEARAAVQQAGGMASPAATYTYTPTTPQSYSQISNNAVTYKSPTVTYQGTTAVNGSQRHTVVQGETLESIGRRYGFTEERLRAMNGFARDGIFHLTPGTELIVNDCHCGGTSGGGAYQQPPVNANNPTVQPQTASVGQPSAPVVYSTPTNTPPKTTPATPPASSNPEMLFFETRVTTNPTNPQPAATTPPSTTPTPMADNASTATPPMVYNTTTTPTVSPTNPTGAGTTTTPNTPNATSTARQPAYVMEHYIQTGETISSIATRFKVSAQEVALINGKDISETLIPGQRILVPRY